MLQGLRQLLIQSQHLEEDAKLASEFGLNVEDERVEELDILDYASKFQQLMFQSVAMQPVDQVILLFACTQGALMRVSADRVLDFEIDWLEFVHQQQPHIVTALASCSVFEPIPPSVNVQLEMALEKFFQEKRYYWTLQIFCVTSNDEG